LNAAWYFAIGFASSTNQIVFLSLLLGSAGALRISWFAYYGDSFDNENYASILVMMEAGLMIGRATNLAPTYVLVAQANYTGYFILLGQILLLLIPPFAASRRNNKSESH